MNKQLRFTRSMWEGARGLTLFLLLLLFTPAVTYADSSNTTTIINNVNTSSTSTSSQQCHTVVKSIVNGREQDIETDNCGQDVNLDDGGNHVHISNNTGGNTIVQQSPSWTPSISLSPTTMISPTQREQKEASDEAAVQHRLANHTKNFWQRVAQWIHDFFSGKFF